MQFKMQALELKITDLWTFLSIPHAFVEGWFLTKSAIHEYAEEMREER